MNEYKKSIPTLKLLQENPIVHSNHDFFFFHPIPLFERKKVSFDLMTTWERENESERKKWTRISCLKTVPVIFVVKTHTNTVLCLLRKLLEQSLIPFRLLLITLYFVFLNYVIIEQIFYWYLKSSNQWQIAWKWDNHIDFFCSCKSRVQE